MSLDSIQQLRHETGAGIMDAKSALEEAEGDLDKARDILRKKGLAKAAKKSEREAKDGKVVSYIHAGGKLGVLLKLYCETDFVARTDEFQALANDLAMHIAAMDPGYISVENIPQEVLEKEKEIYSEQFKDSGKPKEVQDSIIEGKINKFKEEVVLLEQAFIKDSNQKVKDLITEAVAKLGENIQVGDFVRFEL